MLKDRKSTKIILLLIVIILMFVPGFRIFHLRGGLMRHCNMKTVDATYDDLNMLHAESTSGNITITYDENLDGIAIYAENGSSNIGGDDNLTISTISDDIHITIGKDSINEIRASSTSGNVKAEGACLTVLDLSSTSGDVSVRDAEIKRDLTLSSTSGDVEVEDIQSQKLYASTKSGHGRISDSETGSMSFTTISGNISITDTDAEEVRLSTTSGSIVFEAASEYVLTYSSGSGHVTADGNKMQGEGRYGNADSGQTIRFSTVSGHLEIIQ